LTLQPERQVHNSVMEYLSTLKDFTFFTFDRKGGYDPKRGVFRKIKRKWERYDIAPLDIVGWHHLTGRILWFEVKTPKRKRLNKDGEVVNVAATNPFGEQKAFIEHCGATKAFARVVRSIDNTEEAIQAFLKTMPKKVDPAKEMQKLEELYEGIKEYDR
jgi:hypothetical protein